MLLQKITFFSPFLLHWSTDRASDFDMFSNIFAVLFKYLAASAAKYCEKGVGRFENWRGVIGKPILRLFELFGFLQNFKP